jgi:hypothetical protein
MAARRAKRPTRSPVSRQRTRTRPSGTPGRFSFILKAFPLNGRAHYLPNLTIWDSGSAIQEVRKNDPTPRGLNIFTVSSWVTSKVQVRTFLERDHLGLQAQSEATGCFMFSSGQLMGSVFDHRGPVFSLEQQRMNRQQGLERGATVNPRVCQRKNRFQLRPPLVESADSPFSTAGCLR